MSNRKRTGHGRAGYRTARGWSQTKLAEEIGRSRSLIVRIEQGNGLVSIDSLNACADALGVPRHDYIDPRLIPREATP